MTALNQANLGSLSVPVPSYDRSQVKVGIVHFGVGGFHRAHQAMYLDQLMERGKALDWGICGVGVMPFDLKMKEAMQSQDCLYTLVEKAPDGSWEPRVIGSIVQYLYAPDDPDAVIEKMADPATRIVSLTITEGGYNFHPVTGKFDDTNPAVQADLAPGAVPATTFGLVTEALVRRRSRGIEPFTVMSCDNIQGNGHMAQEVFTAFARLRDPELGEWVASNVRFPNSMVDRITPVTTDEDRAQVRERFDIEDAWPVVCEPFTQWALEDNFSAGRPPLEEVGVQVVADVVPYELMKLRLLNASHQALCYFGYLAGYRLVHEVAQDPLFANFLLDYMNTEATPTLAPRAGYRFGRVQAAADRTILQRRRPRYRRPALRQEFGAHSHLAGSGHPGELAAGRDVTLSAAVVASWARYAEGVDEQGEPIEIVDQLADTVRRLAAQQQEDPLAFVKNQELFGDLANEPAFTEPYLKTLDSLHSRGARATLEALARRSTPV